MGALARDPDVYGVLRPRGRSKGLSVKSVSRDIALLLFTLQEPGSLPRYVLDALGEGLEPTIMRLVFDGVLEVRFKGGMRSGPEASEYLCAEVTPFIENGVIPGLSARALRYASNLGIENRVTLSAKLYTYNTAPASARWRRLLPDENAVEKYLGIASTALMRAVERGWSRTQRGDGGGWIGWTSQAVPERRSAPSTHKLYVSPACTDIPSAFEAVAESVARSSAFHWKVGSDVYGLLRPDKMVVYFRDYSELQSTAADILQRLQGCEAQGVPFTAELASNGLLSWGIDPQTERYAAPWKVRESWRSRICDILAGALVQANAAPAAGTQAWTYAMERLRLEGIDTRTWAPTRALSWSGARNE